MQIKITLAFHFSPNMLAKIQKLENTLYKNMDIRSFLVGLKKW